MGNSLSTSNAKQGSWDSVKRKREEFESTYEQDDEEDQAYQGYQDYEEETVEDYNDPYVVYNTVPAIENAAPPIDNVPPQFDNVLPHFEPISTQPEIARPPTGKVVSFSAIPFSTYGDHVATRPPKKKKAKKNFVKRKDRKNQDDKRDDRKFIKDILKRTERKDPTAPHQADDFNTVQFVLTTVIKRYQIDPRAVATASKTWLKFMRPIIEDQFSVNVNNAIYMTNYCCKQVRVFDINKTLMAQAVAHYRDTWGATIRTFEYVFQGLWFDASREYDFEDIQREEPAEMIITINTSQPVKVIIPKHITSLLVRKVGLICASLKINKPLPSNMTSLTYNGPWSTIELPATLPNKLHTLNLPPFNHPAAYTIQSDFNEFEHLRELTLRNFQQELTLIPPSVRKLSIQLSAKHTYTHPINKFPPYLEFLSLLGKFTHHLENIPETVTTLEFGPKQKKSPILDLPRGLRSLLLVFSEPAEQPIPASVTNFTVQIPEYVSMFDMEVAPSVRTLNMWAIKHWEQIEFLKQKAGVALDILPPLTELRLPFFFNNPILALPASLESLYLGPRYNHPLEHLPPNLQFLIFEGRDNALVHSYLAFDVDIPIKFNKPLNNLPDSLKELKFLGSSLFNQHFSKFPASLEVLQFGRITEHTLASRLALATGSRKIFNFATKYKSKFSFKLKYLPETIKYVVMGRKYKHKLGKYLPASAKGFVGTELFARSLKKKKRDIRKRKKSGRYRRNRRRPFAVPFKFAPMLPAQEEQLRILLHQN